MVTNDDDIGIIANFVKFVKTLSAKSNTNTVYCRNNGLKLFYCPKNAMLASMVEMELHVPRVLATPSSHLRVTRRTVILNVIQPPVNQMQSIQSVVGLS